MNKNTISIGIPLTVFLVLAVTTALVASGFVISQPLGHKAAMVQNPIDLPDVLLTDHHNRKAALVSQLVGDDLLVVTFNYTTCESICGVGNAIMQELDKTIGARVKRSVRLLSITINPTVDTSEKLAEAAIPYGPSERWLWTTGRPADIETVLRQSNAQVADIELHQLVFIVGDGKRKAFRRLPTIDPTASDVIAALEEYDS